MPVEPVDLSSLAAARLARLRERLAEAPFDALLVTTPEGVLYATGYRSVAGQIFAGHAMAAVVTGDEVTLVCPASDTAPAIESGVPGDRVVPYGRFYFAGEGAATAMSDRHAGFAEALGVALAPYRGRRFGVAGAVPDGFDRPAMVDATEWLSRLRAVKLPAEQGVLHRAAALAEVGIEAAIAAAAPGVTERELAAVVAATMAAGGGTPRFVVVTAGERSPLADAFPTDRPCRAGDLLRFDVGCVYEGYWSDIARTAVLGGPTARQAASYQALLDGLEAEFAVMRPGATAGEVFRAAVSAVEAGGVAPYRRHHAGHAIGLSVYERPIVGPDEPTIVEPGMVFCLETPYYELGWGGMMVEDTGVVTETGFSLFTGIDRNLRVVPA